jgi:hypothetical protein
LSEDSLYRGLASTRRRRLLYTLRENGKYDIDELAATLSEWESAGARGADHQDRILIELVHSDLPLLAEADVIRYDADNESVEAKPIHPIVDSLLSRSVDADKAP